MSTKTPADVLKLIQEKNIRFVDLKFTDFLGTWHHITVPAHNIDEDVFEEGRGFDGSSIRGWKSIESSDMIMRPDPTTARIDPFHKYPTLSMIGTIHDPISGEGYSRDPRFIAQKAVQWMKSTGIADTAYYGPEAEFFIFDEVRYDMDRNRSFYLIDSVEGAWNTGRDESPNLGYKPRYKGGYFPCAPVDSQVDLRAEMCEEMEKLGLVIEAQHHEVATGGQGEIDMRFDDLLQMADNLQWFKYVVKNVARRNNKVATFMPKPLFGDNGSGMHTHISLWKGGAPLFAGDRYAGLSEMALHFVGGILHHAPALVAITNPTLNSFKRLVPGYEAPVKLAYSSRNRSAAIRIPMYSSSPKAKRIEFRTPDPTCNGYLAFAAMLMAGLDGIENRINPGDPMDRDLYNLPPEEKASIPSAPPNLESALEALAKDHAFLLKGDVFTQDVIDTWIDYKMNHEVDPSRLYPNPLEFALYFDA
jgi:glutamine synthetase